MRIPGGVESINVIAAILQTIRGGEKYSESAKLVYAKGIMYATSSYFYARLRNRAKPRRMKLENSCRGTA